jgi:hypothetical protein
MFIYRERLGLEWVGIVDQERSNLENVSYDICVIFMLAQGFFFWHDGV